jgi:hypothetical protein
MECKNSNKSILPSVDDIKDGLLKMILFSNIDKLFVNDRKVNFQSLLRITSNQIKGKITDESSDEDINDFLIKNKIINERDFIKSLFQESRYNKFGLIIENSNG